MESGKLFQQVRDLKVPMGEYVIFGSGPICARGLRECNDIDLFVTKKFWDSIKETNEWKEGITLKGSQNLKKGDVELIYEWKPGEWNVNTLIAEAEVIGGLPFAKIERVIEWKKLMAREKDFKDIKLVEDYLKM